MKKIILNINILLVLVTLASLLSRTVNPNDFWPVATLGLLFPYLVISNLLFILIWVFYKVPYTLVSIVTLAISWNALGGFFQVNFEDSKLKPYTRWAINAGMRRIWRDRQVLAGRLEAYITQLSDMEAAAFDEERTNAPANWYSLVLARPEPRETSLMYFDVSENELWDNVRGSVLSKEAAWCEGIGFEGENYKSITNGTSQVHMAEWEGNTPKIEHESRWVNYLIEKLEGLIQGLDSLYAELGVVEQAGSYLWKWRSEAPKVDSFNSPPTPPVYWNLKGFYLTEEDALVALEAEFEDLSEKLAADEGDAFERAFLANMVMHGVGGGA